MLSIICRFFRYAAFLGLAVTLSPPPAGADEAASAGEALKAGKVSLKLRLRHESVSDDASPRDAAATTLRTALGYRSAAYKGFSLFLEAENVAVVGNDLYNNAGAGSSGNGVRDRPVVADPAETELNQALLAFADDDWKIALGRQEVVLGDARFVGNVGWRQNHQSFDALRLDNSSLDKVRITYAYLDRVNRIFGDAQEMSSHALWARFEVLESTSLSAYALLLDYDEPTFSTSTFGVELAGKRSVGERAFLYEAEIAEQRDAFDNPATVAAGYSFLMLGAELPAVTLKLGWEVLEGSPGKGRFLTRLATLHAYNGWADKFLTTPVNGLEDLYLSVSGKIGAVGWLVKVHDFGAENGGASYGDELDVQLLYTTPSKVTLGLKGAFYDADQFSVDTDKWMLWASF